MKWLESNLLVLVPFCLLTVAITFGVVVLMATHAWDANKRQAALMAKLNTIIEMHQRAKGK